MTALSGHQDPPLQNGENILAMVPLQGTDDTEQLTPGPHSVTITPAKQGHPFHIIVGPLAAIIPAQGILHAGFAGPRPFQISWLVIPAWKRQPKKRMRMLERLTI